LRDFNKKVKGAFSMIRKIKAKKECPILKESKARKRQFWKLIRKLVVNIQEKIFSIQMF